MRIPFALPCILGLHLWVRALWAQEAQQFEPQPTAEEVAVESQVKRDLSQSDLPNAISNLKKLASHQAGRLGNDHWRVGATNYSIGDAYRRLNQPQLALEYMHKSLPLLEKEFPERKANSGIARYQIAEMYETLGKLDDAAQWYSSSLDKLIDGLASDDENLSKAFVVVAQANQKAGKFEHATATYLRAIETLGVDAHRFPTHITAAMHDYGRNCMDEGRPAEALILFLASTSILEAKLGKDHLHLADVHWDMGKLFEQQGRLEEAMDHFRLTTEIYARNGKRDETSLYRKTTFFQVLAALGYNKESRTAYDEAIADAAALGLGGDAQKDLRRNYILSLMKSYNLSLVRDAFDGFISDESSADEKLLYAGYLVQAGEYEAARRLLEPLQKAFNLKQDTQSLETTLTLLVMCYRRKDEAAAARSTQMRINSLRSDRLGERNGHVIEFRAIAAAEEGKHVEAVELLREAAEALIRDKEMSPVDGARIAELTAQSLFELGPDNHAAAIHNMEVAVDIRGDLYGRKAVLYAATLFNLARVLQDIGQLDQARARFSSACAIMHEYMRNVLPLLSMPEQESLLENMVTPYLSVSLALMNEGRDRDLLYGYVADWKSLLFEATCRNARLARLESNIELRSDLLRLRQVEADIARHYRKPSPQTTERQWEEVYSNLTGEREAIERRLLAKNADLVPDPFVKENAAKVLNDSLPKDRAFVDIYRAIEYGEGAASYQAIISVPSTPLRIARIGDAEEIDRQIIEWHKRVSDSGNAAEEFDLIKQRIWQPIQAVLPEETTAVWVAADGSLSLLPWQLLPSDDSLQVSTAPSPREFVRRLKTIRRPRLRQGDRFLWVQETSVAAPPPESIKRRREFKAFLNDRFDLTERKIEELDTPSLLRFTGESRIAFITAHGLYMPSSNITVPNSTFNNDGLASPATVRVSARRNPLIQSGIVVGGDQDREVVLALDFLRAKLDGCELVIIAGCDTGRGASVDGQGVLGLHSALMASGARWTLVSLWKVPEESTEILMQEFLRGLLQEALSVPTALRRAQKFVRESHGGRFQGIQHWAGWTVVGG
ncbi:CHAT domain-containing protein [Planctomicrobium piriforme]|uniref:Tetratricopeptide repeat-containing protein n=1 Tax=Planctomicrobium piriforme TaxID=1576369 RepID=A0A1I3TK77_9PLAN|nr:CHAT domain-containing tetratricopeptide repeat protein [Planctomicrobium piriforme]SFJ70809.1 Tetratricopeptide repeat-containing protein [Planctomicrobium piriforme]